MEDFLVGVGQLQLKDLDFDTGRDRIAKAVDHLARVLSTSCRPDDKENQIPVVVLPEELQDVLSISGVSMQDLVRSCAPFPKLQPRRRVQCIHGRQRYEAAMQIHGPDMWWTTRIFCLPDGSDVTRLLRREVDQYFHQTAPSDGDIFRKVRTYDEANRHEDVDEWRGRLSKGKRTALRSIELRPRLLGKLDQLRCFPGLWEGFHLGLMERHLALHATEEMLHYLQHIYEVWDRITLHSSSAQEATDTATVLNLELRAPATSANDATSVRQLMGSGIIFNRISEPALRSRLQEEILEIRVLIPSLQTFHANMRYLGIGIMILREFILDDLDGRSVFTAMRDCWENQGHLAVENGEGEFSQVAHHPTAELAYYQVLLAALRDFPRLSTTPPRCERGPRRVEAGVDDASVARFMRGAHKHGFRSQKIAEVLTRVAPRALTASTARDSDLAESSRKRRCGRPFANSFESFAVQLFLPKCIARYSREQHPSALFVQVDIVNAFLGIPQISAPLIRHLSAPSETHLRMPDSASMGMPLPTISNLTLAHMPDSTSSETPNIDMQDIHDSMDTSSAALHPPQTGFVPESILSARQILTSEGRLPNSDQRRYGVFLQERTALEPPTTSTSSDGLARTLVMPSPTASTASSARTLIRPEDLHMWARMVSPDYSENHERELPFRRRSMPQSLHYTDYPSSAHSNGEESTRTIFSPYH